MLRSRIVKKRLVPLQAILLVLALVVGPAWCVAACAEANCDNVAQLSPASQADIPLCHQHSTGKHKSSHVQFCKQLLYFTNQTKTSLASWTGVPGSLTVSKPMQLTPYMLLERIFVWPPGSACSSPLTILRI